MASPSGAKDTERSCPGVSVMRTVSANFVSVTKISPRWTKAISAPSGDTAKSVMLLPTMTGSAAPPMRSAGTVISRGSGASPGRTTWITP